MIAPVVKSAVLTFWAELRCRPAYNTSFGYLGVRIFFWRKTRVTVWWSNWLKAPPIEWVREFFGQVILAKPKLLVLLYVSRNALFYRPREAQFLVHFSWSFAGAFSEDSCRNCSKRILRAIAMGPLIKRQKCEITRKNFRFIYTGSIR